MTSKGALLHSIFFKYLPQYQAGLTWAPKQMKALIASLAGESVRAHFPLYFFIANTSLSKSSQKLHCILDLYACQACASLIFDQNCSGNQNVITNRCSPTMLSTSCFHRKPGWEKALLNTGLAWNSYYCCSLHFNEFYFLPHLYFCG